MTYGLRSNRPKTNPERFFVTKKSQTGSARRSEGKGERKFSTFLKSLGWDRLAEDDPRFFGPTMRSISRQFAVSKSVTSKPIASKPVVRKFQLEPIQERDEPKGTYCNYFFKLSHQQLCITWNFLYFFVLFPAEDGRFQKIWHRLYASPTNESNQLTKRQSGLSKTYSRGIVGNIEEVADIYCGRTEIPQNNIQNLAEIFRDNHFGLPLPTETEIRRSNNESDQFYGLHSKEATNSGQRSEKSPAQSSRNEEMSQIMPPERLLFSFNQPEVNWYLIFYTKVHGYLKC